MDSVSYLEFLKILVDIITCMDCSSNLVALVGAGVLAKVLVVKAWNLTSGFRAYFLAPWGIWRTDLKKYGEWAGEEQRDVDMYMYFFNPIHHLNSFLFS